LPLSITTFFLADVDFAFLLVRGYLRNFSKYLSKVKKFESKNP
jgi:hypothetical protein